MGRYIVQLRPYQADNGKYGLEATGDEEHATTRYNSDGEEERDYTHEPFVERVTAGEYDQIDEIGRAGEGSGDRSVHYRVASAGKVGLLAVTIDRTVRYAGAEPRDEVSTRQALAIAYDAVAEIPAPPGRNRYGTPSSAWTGWPSRAPARRAGRSGRRRTTSRRSRSLPARSPSGSATLEPGTSSSPGSRRPSPTSPTRRCATSPRGSARRRRRHPPSGEG